MSQLPAPPVSVSDQNNTKSQPPYYIGRFAPSPSGPLHMGSLVAALASYLDARSQNGLWLMRMEDLDPPRETREAATHILNTLETIGLQWDGSVLYQSQRSQAYLEAIHSLQQQHKVFACDCSRQKIQSVGGVYPGTCRTRHLKAEPGKALRVQVPDKTIEFTDQIQGLQSQHLSDTVGDFIIKRKDGLFAYQLAVVVDDAFQKVSHIVRGIDLLDSTPRQIYLQQLLGYSQPNYAHIPVIVNNLGQKLSKQHKARPVDPKHSAKLLLTGLRYLNQAPDHALIDASKEEVLQWGIQHWQPANLAQIKLLQEA